MQLFKGHNCLGEKKNSPPYWNFLLRSYRRAVIIYRVRQSVCPVMVRANQRVCVGWGFHGE